MSVLKKAKVVMLPTEKASEFGIHMNGSLCFHPKAKWNLNITPHHLYILSEEEIKEGDWVITTISEIDVYNQIEKFENKCDKLYCKKIIATTDTSLRIGGNTGRRENGISIPIPQPSESFIQKYVEKYNKGEQITEVMVEYEIEEIFDSNAAPDTHPGYEVDVLKISQDNTITIRQVKDSWSREEVVEFLKDWIFTNPILVSDGHGEFPDSYKLSPKNLEDLKQNL